MHDNYAVILADGMVSIHISYFRVASHRFYFLYGCPRECDRLLESNGIRGQPYSLYMEANTPVFRHEENVLLKSALHDDESTISGRNEVPLSFRPVFASHAKDFFPHNTHTCSPFACSWRAPTIDARMI